MMIECHGSTCPAHGVITTSPATMPDAKPRIVGLPTWIHSTSIQIVAAAAAAICVLANASAATLPAIGSSAPGSATAEPALNPNQPNHSKPAPIRVSPSECGGIGVRP